jgi:hypothetical protein
MRERRSYLFILIAAFTIAASAFVMTAFADPAQAPQLPKQTLYSGYATLNKNGDIRIVVPQDVLDANASFSYHVESTGASMPNLYVIPIQDGYFEIDGGAPKSQVLWELYATGK